MSRILEPEDIKNRIQAWANVTMLSLELKLAALRKRHPELSEFDLRELMRKELRMLKETQDDT